LRDRTNITRSFAEIGLVAGSPGDGAQRDFAGKHQSQTKTADRWARARPAGMNFPDRLETLASTDDAICIPG
jgi:hypothetical protein